MSSNGPHRALPVIADEGPYRPATSDDLFGPRGPSILEKQISLQDLLDVKSFRDLCTSFVNLYKIGIKVFDSEGTKMVDIRVGNGDWCGYIFSNRTGSVKCTKLVSKIKTHDYPELESGEVFEQECFSGLKYLIMPITHGGDVLGRVIYGPYVPQELAEPGEAVREFGADFDPERLWEYGSKIRRVPDDTVRKIMINFRQVIDTVISIAFKALMTQHLHLESITDSYNELAEANRALRRNVEKLQEVDRLKASFLAMISHELRTPLTSIIGYSEMLIEGMAGPLSSEQLEFCGTIREKGESLLDLISSLLEVSKIEAGVLRLARTSIDVDQVIQSAQRSVIPLAQKKRIELHTEIAKGLPKIHVDPDKLGQSVSNLLVNAVKFTPEGGRIMIRADQFEGERRYSGDQGRFGVNVERFVRIEVEDTGIGIPKEKLEDVFGAFYQVDNTFTREYGGTGLGLSIVKSFIDAHGGEVWVNSGTDQGTTFTLLVPLEAPAGDAQAAVPEAPRTGG